MSSETVRILIVDDDPAVQWAVQEALPGPQYEIENVAHCDQALARIPEFRPQFILVELEAPGSRGLETVVRMKAAHREAALVVVSHSSESDGVVEALRVGAEDYLTKPLNSEILEIALTNILEKRRLREQVTELRTKLERDHAMDILIGESPGMTRVRETIEQVASTDLNILIRGESGTGKDVTARLIHQLSSTKEGPFVKVNCAALPENLIEAELFGYEKGAFTGAVRAKPGRFQLAHGGAIFLDEITEIPFPLQSKLLQVLEQREFVRVGGTKNTKVDCRCIAATNADMEFEMERKGFREDLFFRLNEFTIHLPPLRERKEDVPLLIDHFLNLYAGRYQRGRRELGRDTIRLMIEYPWPGNVRELESLLKRVLVLDSEEIIHQTLGAPESPSRSYGVSYPPRPADRPGAARTEWEAGAASVRTAERTLTGVPVRHPGAVPSESRPRVQFAESETASLEAPVEDLKTIVDRAVEKAERSAILGTLRATRWNRRKAAKNLGISYSSLLRRIAKYELDAE
jgi:DNA-binding NtrC family response regulator